MALVMAKANLHLLINPDINIGVNQKKSSVLAMTVFLSKQF
jgi:hypothetical protein